MFAIKKSIAIIAITAPLSGACALDADGDIGGVEVDADSMFGPCDEEIDSEALEACLLELSEEEVAERPADAVADELAGLDDGPIEFTVELKDGEVLDVSLDPEEDCIELENFTEVVGERSAINSGQSLYLSKGQTKFVPLTVEAGKSYFVTTTPSSGDPDIYVYRKINGQWKVTAKSLRSAMKVDRLKINASSSELIYVAYVAYTTSGFGASISWESGGALDLDIPYLNQNDIPGIGFAACSSASSAMVLATYGESRVDDMIDTAKTVFAATADTQVGLKGRWLLEQHLEGAWDMSDVFFDDSNWPQLYALIKSEIRAGRPMILGSKSMSAAGHYIVVRGFRGENYGDAKVIVNDPNGRWNSYNSWSTSIDAEGFEYDYTDITSKYSDGVFVIKP